ncbi:SpoIIE family protein phosphatase [Streptomyces spongiae]|uniref:protein-serine/threonine phosphatase n=1 Tax=Streptomyces spongiae TaxID=565072 RepID=A0A5N8XBN3_9ACTN|nr:SpoIIE family protein phosphatase [Streptomyces spongiae]MPY55935.1 SpoIIE family protein phosphatase [Streptomyces spongiae]
MTSHEPRRRLPPSAEQSSILTRAAVVVADHDGRITHWSTGARVLWGYPVEDAVGRPLTDLFTDDGLRPRHRDRHELPVPVDLHLLPGSPGEPGGFLLSARHPGDDGPGHDEDELTRWMFEQYPWPLVVYDPQGRVLRLNEALAKTVGRREDEVRHRTTPQFAQGPVYEEGHRRVLRVARTGVAEVMEAFVRAPGEARAHAWGMDIFPLRDADEDVRAVAVASYDHSEQYGSRQRLAILSEARTRIGTSLDIEGTARELVDVAVPRFADAAAVDLVDAVFEGRLPAPGVPGPDRLRRAASRSVHLPSHGHDSAPGSAPRTLRDTPLARCLSRGEAELLHVTAAEADGLLPGHGRGRPGSCSLIVVPLRARGTMLGSALFLRDAGSREPFDGDDLTVTEDLVARAAVCLDNARRYARERGIALALQRALLPHGRVLHPAAETAVRYLPAEDSAEAGGDWYDVIPLPGARVGLVVGDVVGHGIHASATMGRLRTAVRTLADLDLPPDELLTHLDDIVTHASDGEQDPTGAEPQGDIGARCLYAVYDPVSRVLSLARAGHAPPVLVRPGGVAETLDVPAGPSLGLGSLPFEAVEFALPEDSVLALFTDGLVSAGGQDTDDRMRTLCRCLTPPAASAEEICDRVLSRLETAPRDDDAALLIARTKALDPDHVATWDVPGDPAAVADMRCRASERLTAWGLEEASFMTELVVSELVTNAIRYASAPVRLRLIRDRSLICEVSDGSTTSPHLRRARLSDEGGRGLFLVAELTQRWGTRYTTTGKTIWAEQSLEPA